ncbi:hypothetical protein TUM4637_38630 [Shewanella hafniensis]|nr:hypothetical protein TUM4637_38630 [Shewanella hafniensis]
MVADSIATLTAAKSVAVYGGIAGLSVAYERSRMNFKRGYKVKVLRRMLMRVVF